MLPMSTADRRAALRDTLIDLARDRIAEDGLRALKARDLATSAKCSVGAIYNVFGDLNELSMAVNGETFKALGAHVLAGLAPHADAPAVDRLIAMSESYLDFASENPRLWRALFDISLTRPKRPIGTSARSTGCLRSSTSRLPRSSRIFPRIRYACARARCLVLSTGSCCWGLKTASRVSTGMTCPR
jgi:AcrR family transcriptional regulator